MDINKVDGLAQTLSTHGTAVAIAAFFMLVLSVVISVMISEYKKDREIERKKQQKEDEERVNLYQSQADFMREMTETIVKSTHSAEQMLALLDRTEDMHITLDKKVEGLQIVVNEIKQDVGHDGKVATILTRVEKALEHVVQELKERK